jgi:PAS domain S-box-containing protein
VVLASEGLRDVDAARGRGRGLLRAITGAHWLPLVLALAGFTAATLLWRMLVRLEWNQLTVLSEEEARRESSDLQRGFQAVSQSFTGMAQRHGGAVLREDGPFHLELTGLEATALVEPSGKVRRVDPAKGNHDLADADLTAREADRPALLKARESGKAVVTHSIVLPGGSPGFHLVVPIFDGSRLSGFILAVFSERTIDSAVLEREHAPEWTLAVFEDDRELYRTGPPVGGRWLAKSTFKIVDTERSLRVWPSPKLMARLQSPFPSVVLATGLVISLLLAASAALAQSASRRALEAEAAQGALGKSETRMKAVLDAALDAVILMDAHGLVLSWNPRAEIIFGRSRDEAVGRRLAELIIPPRYREAHAEGLKRFLETGEGPVIGRRMELSALRRDGSEFPVELTVTALREGDAHLFNAFVADISERKRLEALLVQSQKMDSVGRLAGGVAHDFNNLLGVITGYGELLKKRISDQPNLQRYVNDILKAAERAAGLTRQLLAFSRQQVLQPRVLDLNSVVGEMEKMLRRLIGEDIQLVTVFGDGLGRVKADPGQMEQVLMNLAVNARDAMPRGGRLTIETANMELDADYARSRPGVKPGPHVMLAVSDSGHGMDPEVLRQIFDPFFTTKEAGKGTGLGLATVHGIVKQSGGHIFVYSEPEHGTTFKVYLPRLEEAETVVEATAAHDAAVQRGSETVLLVEDEQSLRNIVREILEASGYTVIEARHAAHALEIAEGHSAPVHLLITDVVMPGMGGSDLATHLAASHPETRVLYMSGYTDDAVVLHGVLAADVAFLQKPFTGEALARKVREVLDG